MKKLVLFILLFVSVVAKAQKGISYQAVILDPVKIELPGSDISGQPLVNGNVSVKFVIVSGTNIQFEEIHQTKTDAYGLVNLTIGSVANTAFNAMTWDATQKSLQVYVSFDNGSSYTKVSDEKLTYSPYALFAETAGKLGSTLGIAGGGTGATTAVGARANLGLGNVDNTADVDKPISTATQAALNLKANVADVNAALALKATVSALEAHMAITADTTMLATKAALTDLNNYAPINSPTFTGTVSGVTKSMVGLGSVDNTSDAAKPISTATQAALDLKVNAADANNALALKAPIASPAFTGTVTGITKTMVGLGSVDNTSDAAKPISTATQVALDLKVNAEDANNALALKAPLASPTFTGTVSGIDKTMVGLGSVDNTSDVAKPISTSTQAALSTKAPLASPALTGVPTAPTAAPGTNSEQIATTAYTTAAIAAATAASGVADNSITTSKIANGAVTDAKITSVAGSKITGVIPVASGGTGQTTVAGILSTLGFASNNIAIGSDAGTPNQGVNANTIAIGGGAARTNQGQSSIAIGYVSGDTNQGANSISIGGNAAQGGQGAQAVAIGFAAGQNGQGANAVAIGTFAGQSSQAANSIAINATGTSTPLNPTTSGFFVDPIRSTTATSNLLYYNTSTKEITSGAGSFVDLTTNQTIAGVKTFSSNILANGVSLGRGAGNNDESVAIGQGAMGSSNINGKRNTALGAFAMARYNGTAWDNNTSIGYNNLPNMTSGSGNTSVGAESMMSLVTGQENTSIGNQSLISVTGNSNVGVGKRSGQTITSGSQNTILGTDADVSSATLNNATAIGYGAQVTASNAIQLGNGSVTDVKTSGTITAGAVTYPNTAGTNGYYLKTDGTGTASWAAISGGSSSQWSTANNDIYFNTGNVGIGVSSPGSGFNTNFDLEGRASFRTNGANSGMIFDGYSPSGSLQVARIYTDATSGTPSDFVLGTYPNGHMKQLFLKQSNGYVGVNNDNPTAQLDVTGNIKTSGNLTAGAVTYPNTDGASGYYLKTDGVGIASWAPASGVSSIGSISGSSTANGASITSGVLNLAPADVSNGGIVTTGSQTFAGAKTFNSNLIVNGMTVGATSYATILGINASGNSYTTALGNNASSSGGYSVAIGRFASSAGSYSVAIGGLNATASQSYSVAIGGNGPSATGIYSTAIGGSLPTASATFATAIGSSTTASGLNSTAIGYNAIVSASNTIQLGNSSVTDVKTSGKLTSGTITYPNSDGTSGQVLTTNGSGAASWGDVTAPTGKKFITSITGPITTSNYSSGDVVYDQSAGTFYFFKSPKQNSNAFNNANASFSFFDFGKDVIKFKPSVTGNISSISLDLGNATNAIFSIYGGLAACNAVATVDASTLMGASSTNSGTGIITFTFPTPVAVNANTDYYLTVSSATNSVGYIRVRTGGNDSNFAISYGGCSIDQASPSVQITYSTTYSTL